MPRGDARGGRSDGPESDIGSRIDKPLFLAAASDQHDDDRESGGSQDHESPVSDLGRVEVFSSRVALAAVSLAGTGSSTNGAGGGGGGSALVAEPADSTPAALAAAVE